MISESDERKQMNENIGKPKDEEEGDIDVQDKEMMEEENKFEDEL